MEDALTALAESTAQAVDLETLTRPLLSLLHRVTGLESTYLTMVDEVNGVQHILFSSNEDSLQIPEGLAVPWHDTLCKRAMEEGRPYTDDVASCWGDSEAARALGIRTYMSQPVTRIDGALYGTLCGASSRAQGPERGALEILSMCAQLIAHQIERELAMGKLRESNAALVADALSDSLTGLANRRALQRALKRILAHAQRREQPVQVAFIDLDHFKRVNDRYGHATGDRLLVHISNRLLQAVRPEDMVARYGGDEFVVIAADISAEKLRDRLDKTMTREFEKDGELIEHAGASIGLVTWTAKDPADPAALLSRADRQMYEIKQARKS